jgi:hypothetical protein
LGGVPARCWLAFRERAGRQVQSHERPGAHLPRAPARPGGIQVHVPGEEPHHRVERAELCQTRGRNHRGMGMMRMKLNLSLMVKRNCNLYLFFPSLFFFLFPFLFRSSLMSVLPLRQHRLHSYLRRAHGSLSADLPRGSGEWKGKLAEGGSAVLLLRKRTNDTRNERTKR